MPFIIDGNNLLWAANDVPEVPGLLSDIKLCGILNRFLKRYRDNAEIVFDGPEPKEKGRLLGFSQIEVSFSGVKKNADTVIKSKIKSSSAPRKLTLVTSDRELQKQARTVKAQVIKAQLFWKIVKKQLREKKPEHREHPAKQTGLNRAETKLWLEFFDIEKD